MGRVTKMAAKYETDLIYIDAIEDIVPEVELKPTKFILRVPDVAPYKI